MPTMYISEEIRIKWEKLCLLEHRSSIDELEFLADLRLEELKQAKVSTGAEK